MQRFRTKIAQSVARKAHIRRWAVRYAMPASRATSFKSLCCSRWGCSSRKRSKATFRADSDKEARAIMPISAFRFAHHTPNSVEKKAPNNLETYTQIGQKIPFPCALTCDNVL